MISTLLFDLDDTMVAYEAVTGASWRKACASLLGVNDCMSIDSVCSTILKHSNWYWSDEERARRGRQDMISARRELVGAAFQELELPAQDAIRVADLFSRIRVEDMYLLPNTAETLSHFKNNRLRMALVTNGDSAGQRAKIARFDLEKFFDLILIEGELGFGKPDPRIFAQALQRLGSSPENALMIGDNLVWDIAGAQSTGVNGIWFNWKGSDLPREAPGKPFATITDLSQLKDIVGIDST